MISFYFPIHWTVKVLKESSNDHTLLEAAVRRGSTKKVLITKNPGIWLDSAKIISKAMSYGGLWQIADELFECFWPFCGVGSYRVK